MNPLKTFRVISAVAAALASAAAAHAAPTGGVVVAGAASISSTPGATTIQQTSARAALDWQGFDIGATETVSFIQPDAHSVALNRVLGADPSRILGSLTANGKVFLVNPQGVLFGKGAQVAVGGLVASTRDIAVADFMAGDYHFTGESDAAILNEGSITAADGGYVALLGAHVANDGDILAPQGTVALAAGNGFTLDVGGDGLLNVAVDAGAVDALARNGGLLQADGGRVLMTARSASALFASAVNNTGTVRAQSMIDRGGTILLLGDATSGSVDVNGRLDAGAPDSGDGGFIETSAATVRIGADAMISTSAPHGATGLWLIDPFDFTIAASGGDVTGAALSSQLENSNVSVLSTAGAGGTRGDLYVNDTVAWSANQLTLNAAADIIVNAPLVASGTASLALAYGTGAVAAGNTAALSVRAPVDLPTGNTLSVQLGSDGAVANYAVINSMAALQAINSSPSGNYALGSNLNASGFAGYVPIGTNASRFSGAFNGLGHTISNLSVSSGSDNAGLFGVTDTTALITSLRMSTTSVNIAGRNNAGSLVGWNYGTVRDVYTTGVSINAARQAGGLVGYNSGLIESSASGTGTTTATFFSGGLVAYQVSPGVIRNSYSGVTSRNNLEVGGLVGGMDGGSVENSYANSTPSGSTALFGTGGLVGYVGGGTVSNSHWNTSRYAVGVRTGSTAGMTGLTSTQMQAQANFAWDFDRVWVMYEGLTLPLLRAFMTPLTVTPNPAVSTYSGAAYAGTPGVSYSRTPNLANVLGTASYASAGTNVGSHALTTAGLYSNQLGYLITFAPGVLTINPHAVSLTGSRAYDGATGVAANVLTLGSLVNGETLTLAGEGTVAASSVGAGKTIALGTLALVDGTGLASNYTFAGAAQTLDIVPAVLTAAAVAADKSYDGTTLADVTLTVDGLIGSETLDLAAVGAFNSKDVATANLVTVTSVTLGDGTNGGLAANYTLTAGQTTAAHITPKVLSAAAEAADKVYDGGVAAAVDVSLTGGLVGAETLTVFVSGTFDSKDASDARVATIDSVLLEDGANGGLASNYSLAAGQTAVARIAPKSLLVVNQTAVDKIWDGSTAATLSGGALSGLVAGDTVELLESGVFASAEVGEAIAVNATDALSGADALNYALIQPTALSASIKALPALPPVAPPVVPPVETSAPPAVVPEPAPTPAPVPPYVVAVASDAYRGAIAVLSGPRVVLAPGSPAITMSVPPPIRTVVDGLNLEVITRDEEMAAAP